MRSNQGRHGCHRRGIDSEGHVIDVRGEHVCMERNTEAPECVALRSQSIWKLRLIVETWLIEWCVFDSSEFKSVIWAPSLEWMCTMLLLLICCGLAIWEIWHTQGMRIECLKKCLMKSVWSQGWLRRHGGFVTQVAFILCFLVGQSHAAGHEVIVEINANGVHAEGGHVTDLLDDFRSNKWAIAVVTE